MSLKGLSPAYPLPGVFGIFEALSSAPFWKKTAAFERASFQCFFTYGPLPIFPSSPFIFPGEIPFLDSRPPLSQVSPRSSESFLDSRFVTPFS